MADRLVLDPVEQRVLGVLLEKQRTVPDIYPLSLNALRAGCNQATSRDPVGAYDEPTLLEAVGRLRDRGLVRFLKPTGLRVVKYHQRLEEHLRLTGPQAALLAVLLLRGAQTAGELRPRTERLHPFPDRESVEAALGELAGAEVPLVAELDRQPAQHDRRWVHLLGADEPAVEPSPAVDREVVLAAGAGARDRLVAGEYDRLAGSYGEALGDDLDGKPFDRWLLDRLAADAVDGPGLDVGCGPGQVAAYLAGRGVRMTGLDLSPGMIAQLQARHPEVEAVRGSFTLPPMPRGGDPRDPGWALITAWCAFVHLAASELWPTLTALTRALRRDGRLAVATHVGAEVRHPGALFGVDIDLDFVLHDPDAVVAAAEAAGLVDLEWYVRSPLPHEAATRRVYLVGRRGS